MVAILPLLARFDPKKLAKGVAGRANNEAQAMPRTHCTADCTPTRNRSVMFVLHCAVHSHAHGRPFRAPSSHSSDDGQAQITVHEPRPVSANSCRPWPPSCCVTTYAGKRACCSLRRTPGLLPVEPPSQAAHRAVSTHLCEACDSSAYLCCRPRLLISDRARMCVRVQPSVEYTAHIPAAAAPAPRPSLDLPVAEWDMADSMPYCRSSRKARPP